MSGSLSELPIRDFAALSYANHFITKNRNSTEQVLSVFCCGNAITMPPMPKPARAVVISKPRIDSIISPAILIASTLKIRCPSRIRDCGIRNFRRAWCGPAQSKRLLSENDQPSHAPKEIGISSKIVPDQLLFHLGIAKGTDWQCLTAGNQGK